MHDDGSLLRRLGPVARRGRRQARAVRPVGWILAHAPELRVRALVVPTLEDDLLAAALLGLPAPAPLLSDSHPRCGRRTTALPSATSPGRSACPTRRPTRAPINSCGAVLSTPGWNWLFRFAKHPLKLGCQHLYHVEFGTCLAHRVHIELLRLGEVIGRLRVEPR